MPLQVVQRYTTSREFGLWCTYLEKKQRRVEPIYHYLARIAYEIARMRNPKKRYKLEQFIIKFESPQRSRPVTQAQKEAQMQQSMSFWLSSVMGEEGLQKLNEDSPDVISD